MNVNVTISRQCANLCKIAVESFVRNGKENSVAAGLTKSPSWLVEEELLLEELKTAMEHRS